MSWKIPQVCSPIGQLVSERTFNHVMMMTFLNEVKIYHQPSFFSLMRIYIGTEEWKSHFLKLIVIFERMNLDWRNVSRGFNGSYGNLALFQLSHDVICSSNNKCVSALMGREMEVCVLPQVDNL